MNNLRFQTDLMEYLPDWYKPIEDYHQILNAEGEEFDTLKDDVLDIYANLFFLSADAGTISQWEQIFFITPSSDETLEFRRQRILNRIAMKPPFTIRFLEQKLDELIGPGMYTVTVDSSNFTLYVDTVSQDQEYAIEVSYTINHTKPAHIIYINRPNITTGILLCESVDKINYDWQYILGSWYLGNSPFVSGSTTVEVKMASTPSVTSTALADLASDLNARVAKARVNNSIVITSITKTITNSTLEVEYTVAPADTASVTKLELLDSSNNVLTSSGVYVPITQVTNFKHIIPIKEGTNGN